MSKIKSAAKKIPLVNKAGVSILRSLSNASFSGSDKYWERRYHTGGNSGAGSYGKFSEFKADVINSFVKEKKITSVIEFGCGDGNQLALFDFPKYTGLDVSNTAITLCKERFRNDSTKIFLVYEPESFNSDSEFKADLSLSLDVIYHLIENDIFELHMKHLFSSAKRFVIIYSSNNNRKREIDHVKHRNFTDWIKTNLPEWELIEQIKNKYSEETPADFFIFKKNRHHKFN